VSSPPAFPQTSHLASYTSWLSTHRNSTFETYDDLWRWSVEDLDGFWTSIWEYFGASADSPPDAALAQPTMPGTQWFPGTSLNYADRVLGRHPDDGVALMIGSERTTPSAVTWRDLRADVAAVAAGLSRLGVNRGDRVAAVLPNVYETVVAFLASASLGAVWACCSPDLGAQAIIDRFEQLAPKVLLCADGYEYAGRTFDRSDLLEEVSSALHSIQTTIVVPILGTAAPAERSAPAVTWAELSAPADVLSCMPVAFDHPLWVLFSSGTTGKPKAIVHSHGGILLEHLKAHHLHLDLHEGDRFLWYTSSGWMMWNFLISGLLTGATVVLYDGSPTHPTPDRLWSFADEADVTFFGTSAAFLAASQRAEIDPRRGGRFAKLRALASTGSVLTPRVFAWAQAAVGGEVTVMSLSGGTDVCTAFIGGVPGRRSLAGELVARWLGCAAHAFDRDGRPLTGRVGELVITRPMPSMPERFWADPDMARYRDAYFDVFPDVWRHGDWVEISTDGTAVIHGRSDATINRAGIRIGTAEIYRCLEPFPEIEHSLVVDLPRPGTEGWMILFLSVADGHVVTAEVSERIMESIRANASPRHVPDEIRVAPDIPRTNNGKVLEVPTKRILMGASPDDVVQQATLLNPNSLGYFAQLAAKWKSAEV
jgi:acetoacetyl-CoA synthetase